MGVSSISRAALAAGFAVSFAASHAGAQALVKGFLVDDSTGAPIRASVMLVDPATNGPVVRAVSDSAGQFSLRAQQGVYQIAAVRDGYTSVLSVPIPLQNGERLTIQVPMAHQGDPKHQIGVMEHVGGASHGDARPVDNTDAAGVEARRAAGLGLHYTHAQLIRSNRETLGEFLQGVPGLTVLSPTSTSTVSASRSFAMQQSSSSRLTSCHLGWFLDGHRLDLPGIVDATVDQISAMRLDNVQDLEVFRGISEMPSEFADPDLKCGAIAVWTRK